MHLQERRTRIGPGRRDGAGVWGRAGGGRPRRSRGGGFTLVELLVLVGIVAVLLGVLLPTVSRAIEAGNRTKCLSNLRQIGLAVQMYAQDWRGLYPAGARCGPTQPGGGANQSNVADFVYWEGSKPYWVRPNEMALLPGLTAAQDRDLGALVPCMGRHFDPAVWVCPDDLPAAHPLLQYTLLRYPYSYTMNYFFDQALSTVNTGAAQYLNSTGAPLRSNRVRPRRRAGVRIARPAVDGLGHQLGRPGPSARTVWSPARSTRPRPGPARLSTTRPPARFGTSATRPARRRRSRTRSTTRASRSAPPAAARSSPTPPATTRSSARSTTPPRPASPTSSRRTASTPRARSPAGETCCSPTAARSTTRSCSRRPPSPSRRRSDWSPRRRCWPAAAVAAPDSPVRVDPRSTSAIGIPGVAARVVRPARRGTPTEIRPMRKGIHPAYRPVVFKDVTAGFAFLTRSTIKSSDTIVWEDGKEYPLVKVDISSASHPFKAAGPASDCGDRVHGSPGLGTMRSWVVNSTLCHKSRPAKTYVAERLRALPCSTPWPAASRRSVAPQIGRRYEAQPAGTAAVRQSRSARPTSGSVRRYRRVGAAVGDFAATDWSCRMLHKAAGRPASPATKPGRLDGIRVPGLTFRVVDDSANPRQEYFRISAGYIAMRGVDRFLAT